MLLNRHSNFHAMETVASTWEVVIGPSLCHLHHVTSSSCHVRYELPVYAALIACLVHLQNIEVSFVKHEHFMKFITIRYITTKSTIYVMHITIFFWIFLTVQKHKFGVSCVFDTVNIVSDHEGKNRNETLISKVDNNWWFMCISLRWI